jgi:predicted lipoprotein with Yx(FWY)xxD motif
VYRSLLLPALLAAVMAAAPATAQRLNDSDPVDLEEIYEEQYRAPYYGTTSDGFGRAQRPYLDKVPQRILSGGFLYTNAKYFKGLGKVLTDKQDMTLYATRLDRDHEVSSLSGDALQRWKPIVVRENAHLSGLWGKAWNDSLNAWVLTLVDKPLYRYVGDEEPGQARGANDDFYVLEIIG